MPSILTFRATLGLGGPGASDSAARFFRRSAAATGAQLEPRKDPVEILVFDHAERVPSENWARSTGDAIRRAKIGGVKALPTMARYNEKHCIQCVPGDEGANEFASQGPEHVGYNGYNSLS